MSRSTMQLVRTLEIPILALEFL